MRSDDVTRCILFSLAAFCAFAGMMLPATAPEWLSYAAGGLSLACIAVGFGVGDADD